MTGVIAVLAAARKIQPITATNWGINSGSSPQSSAARALTVPAGNPGVIRFASVGVSVGATFQYSKNAGTLTTVTEGGTVSVANGDTISFRVSGVAFDSASVSVVDNTTGASIGTWLGTLS